MKACYATNKTRYGLSWDFCTSKCYGCKQVTWAWKFRDSCQLNAIKTLIADHAGGQICFFSANIRIYPQISAFTHKYPQSSAFICKKIRKYPHLSAKIRIYPQKSAFIHRYPPKSAFMGKTPHFFCKKSAFFRLFPQISASIRKKPHLCANSRKNYNGLWRLWRHWHNYR